MKNNETVRMRLIRFCQSEPLTKKKRFVRWCFRTFSHTYWELGWNLILKKDLPAIFCFDSVPEYETPLQIQTGKEQRPLSHNCKSEQTHSCCK